ncbi:NRT1/ PTR family 6.4-like protein [Tanacetum coccineum]
MMKLPPCNDSGNCVEADTSQRVMLYTTLYTVALGGGSIKSNVSGFGSDFDKSDPKEEKAMVYFFNRFYFCVSLGSLFAATIMVNQKTFEGNTRDLGSILDETGQECNFYPNEGLKNDLHMVETTLRILATPFGFASDRVRRNCDGVWTIADIKNSRRFYGTTAS